MVDEVGHPGIVHEHIEPAQLAGRVPDHGPNTGVVRHITPAQDRPSSTPLNLGHGVRSLRLGFRVVDGHVETALRQQDRCRATDSGRGTGDQSHTRCRGVVHELTPNYFA